MKRKVTKKQGLLQILFILAISFVILTANIKSDTHSWIEAVVINIFSPVQDGITTATTSVTALFSKYFFLVGLEDSYNQLGDENRRLNIKLNNLKEQLLKKDRVTTLLNLTASLDNKIVVVNVVGFDASSWSKMIIIDKGTNDLLRKNQAVMTHEGLVGRLVTVTSGYSKTLLITDARSAVDALVQRTRDRGVVVGTNKNYCEMKYVSINSDIKEGDKIITSGTGGTVQKGLPIGIVSAITIEENGLFKNVIIAPSAALDKLEEVLVVFNESVLGEGQ